MFRPLALSRRIALAWRGAAALVLAPPLVSLVACGALSPALGQAWADTAAREALGRGLQMAAEAALLGMLAGGACGWALARRAVAGRRLWLFLLPGALVLAPTLTAHAWKLALSPDGWLGTWIAPPPAAAAPTSLHLGALVLAAAYWPLVAWLARWGARIPRELLDAALLELPGGRAEWWTARPVFLTGVWTGGLLLFLLALGDFGVPSSLGLPVFAVEAASRFQFNREPLETAAFGFPVCLAVLGILTLAMRPLHEATRPFSPGEPEAPARRPSPGAALLLAGLLVGGLVAPFCTLIAESLPPGTYLTIARENVTPLWTTLWTSLAAALGSSLLALAWHAPTRRKVCSGRDSGAIGPGTAIATAVVCLPLVLPASLTAAGVVFLLNRPGLPGDLYDSPLALVWTYMVLFTGLAILSQRPGWQRGDAELLDVARSEGAGCVRTWRLVWWPAVRTPFLVGFTGVLLLAAREMDATALVRPPGHETIAFQIHDYLHYSPGPNLAALAVSLTGLGWIALALLWRLSRERNEP